MHGGNKTFPKKYNILRANCMGCKKPFGKKFIATVCLPVGLEWQGGNDTTKSPRQGGGLPWMQKRSGNHPRCQTHAPLPFSLGAFYGLFCPITKIKAWTPKKFLSVVIPNYRLHKAPFFVGEWAECP